MSTRENIRLIARTSLGSNYVRLIHFIFNNRNIQGKDLASKIKPLIAVRSKAVFYGGGFFAQIVCGGVISPCFVVQCFMTVLGL